MYIHIIHSYKPETHKSIKTHTNKQMHTYTYFTHTYFHKYIRIHRHTHIHTPTSYTYTHIHIQHSKPIYHWRVKVSISIYSCIDYEKK